MGAGKVPRVAPRDLYRDSEIERQMVAMFKKRRELKTRFCPLYAVGVRFPVQTVQI